MILKQPVYTESQVTEKTFRFKQDFVRAGMIVPLDGK